ncbi:hypothetical protein CICLE_v10016186mg [Citrus x clementina]|uniref:Association with the SNF1 complex (ASC) domain-containing protein n=1 Tax=Citrus clementina TaxID=85681 RepID=V4U1B5_CITCL|nr:hypothetical protein CICLE_v10016186mg [Citrus x clementina]
MGNANGREEGGGGGAGAGGAGAGANDEIQINGGDHSMSNISPPATPHRSRSPLLFAPQVRIRVPVAPLQRADDPPLYNQMRQHESHAAASNPLEKGVPTIITWNYGGNEVAVEGSWDNWTSRRILHRSGKDHSILLVLPSGVYHYKFIVDGDWRYIPDLPFVADELGGVCNLLDVHSCVPEILDSVAEFEAPASPESSYSQALPSEEDCAKEPLTVPSQLHLTLLGTENSDEASSSKPKHVVLNHVFVDDGWKSKSVVALGLTHRFQSKYVTVVLYKPHKR